MFRRGRGAGGGEASIWDTGIVAAAARRINFRVG